MRVLTFIQILLLSSSSSLLNNTTTTMNARTENGIQRRKRDEFGRRVVDDFLCDGKQNGRRKRDEFGRRVHVDSQGVTRVFSPKEKKWIVVDDSLCSSSSSASETLLLEGPAFTSRYDFEKGEFRVNSKPLVVKRASETRDVSSQQDGDTVRTLAMRNSLSTIFTPSSTGSNDMGRCSRPS